MPKQISSFSSVAEDYSEESKSSVLGDKTNQNIEASDNSEIAGTQTEKKLMQRKVGITSENINPKRKNKRRSN